MKHIKYLSFILLITLFSACSKEDNAKLPDGIQKVNIPVIKKDANSQTNINFSDISSFEGKYTVNYYFADGVKPEKADVIVIKNGVKTNPKVINAGVTTFPSSFSTTAAALEALFGQPTALGDSYAIGMDLFVDGKKYEAFPVVGNAYGTAFNNLPGASLTIKYDAVCPFNFENYYGDFEVVSDEWVDYAVGDVIQVSKVSDVAVSFNYNCSNPIPIVLNLNSTTGAISGDKKEYCSYSLPPLTKFFGDIVEGKSSVDNCAKTLTVRILHSDENGVVYGEGTIVLKKK